MRGYTYPHTGDYSSPAFYALDAGIPAIHGSVAMTQAAGAFNTAGVETFVGSAAMTQLRAAITASGIETFFGAAGMTQARATITSSGDVTDPPLVIGGIGGAIQVVWVEEPAVRGRARLRQRVGVIVARGHVQQLVAGVARANQEASALCSSGRVKNHRVGRGAVAGGGSATSAIGLVRGRIRGTATLTQPASALTIEASAHWYEDDEERLLLGISDS